jgi:serine/threonine-protein kinase HipA
LEHFETFGTNLGLTQKQIKGVFKRFLANKTKAVKLIKNPFYQKK